MRVTPEPDRVSPWSLGGPGIIELGKRVWSEANEDELFDRAAALSYYFVFAIFPALLFLTSLLGMLPNPDLMNRIMAYVAQAMPADAASIVERTLSEVVGGARGSLLSIGAIAALWAASGGLSAMMTALSVTYDVQDSRSWWKRKVIALGLTFALAIVLLSAAVLMVFGGHVPITCGACAAKSRPPGMIAGTVFGNRPSSMREPIKRRSRRVVLQQMPAIRGQFLRPMGPRPRLFRRSSRYARPRESISTNFPVSSNLPRGRSVAAIAA